MDDGFKIRKLKDAFEVDQKAFCRGIYTYLPTYA